jgi:Dynamitin
MENNTTVLETPELQKTIEEINDEIEPKIFSHNLGLENKPRDMSLAEIYEIFNGDTNKTIKFNYIKEPKVTKSRENQIKAMEAEFISIKSLIETTKGPEYTDLSVELLEIEQKLEKIKEKSQSVSKKHVFSSDIPHRINISDSFANNTSYELNLTDQDEKVKINRLENKVRELEYVLGTWKQARSVSEVLPELLNKTKFLNLDLLERIKDQSGHLATDLDIILSTETQPNANENIEKINELYKDTYSSLSSIHKLTLYIDRLKSSSVLYKSHTNLANTLLNLEVSSENILGKASQSVLALEQLRQGISESLNTFSKNLKTLKIN